MPEENQLPTAMRELLTLCEKLYFERSVLEALLKESSLPWKEKYDEALHNPSMRAYARRAFQDAAIRVCHAGIYESSLQALLVYLETTGKPN